MIICTQWCLRLQKYGAVLRDEPEYLFAGAVPARELLNGAREIEPDMIVEGVEFTRSVRDGACVPQHPEYLISCVGYLLDFKMMHVGS